MIMDIQAASLEAAQVEVRKKFPRRAKAFLVVDTPNMVRSAIAQKLERAKQSKQYRDQAIALQGVLDALDKGVRSGTHSARVVAEAMLAHGDTRTEMHDGFAYIQVGQAPRWLVFSKG
jgi:hypothetical protein